jgi:hypothetical protein
VALEGLLYGKGVLEAIETVAKLPIWKAFNMPDIIKKTRASAASSISDSQAILGYG